MAGLLASLPTFASGFQQGYGFMQNVANQNYQKRRQQQQDTQNAAQVALQDKYAAADEQRKQRDFQYRQQARQRTLGLQHALALQYAAYHGGVTPDAFDAVSFDVGGPSAEHITSPEYGQALDTQAQLGAGKIRYNDPAHIAAQNVLHQHSINKGVGDTYPDGAVTVGKQLAGNYPAPDGSGTVQKLAISMVGQDGSPRPVMYKPMTEGRGTTDNAVKVAPVQAHIDGYVGAKFWRNLLQADPATQQRMTNMLVAYYGGDPDAYAPKPQKPQRADYAEYNFGPGKGFGVFDRRTGQRIKYGQNAPAAVATGPKQTYHAVPQNLAQTTFARDPASLKPDQWGNLNSTAPFSATKVRAAEAYAKAHDMPFSQESVMGYIAAGRPGASPAKPQTSPYPDGTTLRGKDGRTYIVRNGVPVPIGQ